jgi:hypothetical protein
MPGENREVQALKPIQFGIQFGSAVRVYRERRWGRVAAVVAGVLFIIVALIALFVSGFD